MAKVTKVEILKTWKVRSTKDGCDLTINGKTFRMNHATAQSMGFDLDRAGRGYNVPGVEREAER